MESSFIVGCLCVFDFNTKLNCYSEDKLALEELTGITSHPSPETPEGNTNAADHQEPEESESLKVQQCKFAMLIHSRRWRS